MRHDNENITVSSITVLRKLPIYYQFYYPNYELRQRLMAKMAKVVKSGRQGEIEGSKLEYKNMLIFGGSPVSLPEEKIIYLLK